MHHPPATFWKPFVRVGKFILEEEIFFFLEEEEILRE